MNILTGARWTGRRGLVLPLVTLVAAMTASLAPATAFAHGNRLSLDVLQAGDARLAAVGYRLATASADRCANPTMLTGLILHDLGQYDAKDRGLVAARTGLSDGIGVENVVAGSVAQSTGLRSGDEIVAIEGVDTRVAEATLPKIASFSRVEAANKLIQAALTAGPVHLSVRRSGQLVSLDLAGVSGCGGDMVLAPSNVLNAWSDGTHVVVTTRLMSLAANDDELAFVVAHEMSHNNLHHRERLGSAANGLFAAFGHTAARIKETEIEADTAAIGLMEAAGYRLDSAPAFLARAGRGRVLDLATTHPANGRRIKIVMAAIGTVQAVPAQQTKFAAAVQTMWSTPLRLEPVLGDRPLLTSATTASSIIIPDLGYALPAVLPMPSISPRTAILATQSASTGEVGLRCSRAISDSHFGPLSAAWTVPNPSSHTLWALMLPGDPTLITLKVSTGSAGVVSANSNYFWARSFVSSLGTGLPQSD